MKNENYDYQCPRCATRNITFKDIHNDKLVFHCNVCDEDFITTDRESKYIAPQNQFVAPAVSLKKERRC